MRKRIGSNEQLSLNSALRLVRNFRIFYQHKNKGETYFNDLLIHHLKQKLPVKNRSIRCAEMVGEKFRPECFIQGSGAIPLCAFECKKLTQAFAKARWKEGISQAILYAQCYKAAILVFYDYTKGGAYKRAFASPRSIESRFAKALREAFHIHVIVIRPEN